MYYKKVSYIKYIQNYYYYNKRCKQLKNIFFCLDRIKSYFLFLSNLTKVFQHFDFVIKCWEYISIGGKKIKCLFTYKILTKFGKLNKDENKNMYKADYRRFDKCLKYK